MHGKTTIKKSIAEICPFQGYVPVSPVVFCIAIDECTRVTKFEFSRNLYKVKYVLFASEDYYSKFSSGSLFPRYHLHQVPHWLLYSLCPRQIFFSVQNLLRVSAFCKTILTHRRQNVKTISAYATHF
jgi:hypothetical protein